VVVIAIQEEDVDAEIRVHVIVLTVVETIIHRINAGTSLVKRNGRRLLTSTSAATSSTTSSIVQIFQLNYEFFVRLQTAQASQSANTILHEPTSGTSAFIASYNKILSISFKNFRSYERHQKTFHSLSFLDNIPPVNIADGTS